MKTEIGLDFRVQKKQKRKKKSNELAIKLRITAHKNVSVDLLLPAHISFLEMFN